MVVILSLDGWQVNPKGVLFLEAKKLSHLLPNLENRGSRVLLILNSSPCIFRLWFTVSLAGQTLPKEVGFLSVWFWFISMCL